jgi:D-lactate dehydrogenase
MKIVIYTSKTYEQKHLLSALHSHEVVFINESLSLNTINKAINADALVVFVNDSVSGEIMINLKATNPCLKGIATRAAGHDNIDLKTAKELGLRIANVPSYSPNAIAEITIALMLALNRKLILSDRQVHASNFSLNNLVGFNMKGKSVGIIGTGRIGCLVAEILNAFGCVVLAYDINVPPESSKSNIKYVELDFLYKNADIITIHAPLNPSTKYLINKESISKMKTGVMLINTGRGGIVKTSDVIIGLKEGKIGYLGLDVYEKESGIFFEDHSNQELKDHELKALLSFPNVLLTGHQGFLTHEALESIAHTTAYNINCWDKGIACKNDLWIP